MATEDLPPLRVLGGSNVSRIKFIITPMSGHHTDDLESASAACAVRVAFAVQARGTTDATMAQYYGLTML